MAGTKVAVLGGGNGGFAAAADLAQRGYQVSLYNRSLDTIAAVRAAGGIRFRGVLGSGFAPVQATTDMGEAVAGAGLVQICAPALAHPGYAAALAPHLKDGMLIVLNPGNMLGSVAFLVALRAAGCQGRVQIGETNTLTYICRKDDPGAINVTSALKAVPFAALPGTETADLIRKLADFNLNLTAEESILPVGLANVNLVLHPPGMILAAAWIERTGGDFAYYYDAATPAVARVMEAIDHERMAIARAYGVAAEPFPVLFHRIGSTSAEAAESGSYLQTLLDSAPNRQIKAPPQLDHRYLSEDIPCGLVPMAELGARAGVATPVMDSLITLAGTVNRKDYRADGRRMAALGMDGLDRNAILQALRTGDGFVS